MPARPSDKGRMGVKTLADARLYNTYEISPYLKENTTVHHYKD
jgi:hypothetical protein